MHKRADTIVVIFVVALIILACITSVATADNDRSKKNKDHPDRDDDDDDRDKYIFQPSVKPWPTKKPTPLPKPTLKPIPTPIPTQVPAPTPTAIPEPAVPTSKTVLPEPYNNPIPATGTAIPTPEPARVTITADIGARDSTSLSEAPRSGTRPLPTPLVSGVKLARPDTNIGSILAVFIGIACVGYMAYLGSIMLRK